MPASDLVPRPAAAFAWANDLPQYDFGPGHPMAPIRLELTRELIRALRLPGLTEIDVDSVTEADLELVHDAAFVAAVQAGAVGIRSEEFGLGTDDNPLFPEIHAAASRIVGSTLAAARAVWTSQVSHAVSFAGGMHHAMPAKASGFCVYNDVGVAIRWLLDQGAQRVAYVDLDAHHGDGVERIFWDDPRVMTISVHESGLTLFPGTGFAYETGGPGAEGTAVNVALPAQTGGDAWLRAIDAVVPPLLAEFAPDVLVSQHGADSHPSDPLTNLRVSVDHQLAGARMMRELASEHASGRWVATGGGGYTVVEVVPRVWAGLVAISAGIDPDLSQRLPLRWRLDVGDRGLPAPLLWGDGDGVTLRPFSAGYDPADDVDRAILATRHAVFPHHGLDPAW
ncbi:acetoin utilization protein AcuC [Salana multivorans]